MESIFDNPHYKERWAMYDSALKAGLPIVSRETCAIICAMLLVWGNSEEFTHNHRLVCELQYAQKRFHIEGSESPDADFARLLQSYVSQLELMQQREDRVPDHIDALFQERYGFHFNKE
jgi:ferritin